MKGVFAKEDGEEKQDIDPKAVRTIVEILTEEKYTEELKINTVLALKRLFNKCVPTLQNKIFHLLDVKSLFEIVVAAEKEDIDCKNEFCLEYGNFLLNCVNNEVSFLSSIRSQLKWVLKQLDTKQDTYQPLIRNIWISLEQNFLIWPDVIDDIILSSKDIIEEKVFQWVVNCQTNPNIEDSNIKFYVHASSECKGLFKTISRILNQFVIMSNGNGKILDLVKQYVCRVTENCDKIGKSFFSLYPRSYCRIISFLFLPPELTPTNKSKKINHAWTKNETLEQFLLEYKENKYMILLLLTHFSQWLGEFRVFLEKGNSYNNLNQVS